MLEAVLGFQGVSPRHERQVVLQPVEEDVVQGPLGATSPLLGMGMAPAALVCCMALVVVLCGQIPVFDEDSPWQVAESTRRIIAKPCGPLHSLGCLLSGTCPPLGWGRQSGGG